MKATSVRQLLAFSAGAAASPPRRRRRSATKFLRASARQRWLAKTASRSTLGFMNEMAFELRYHIANTDGLRRCDIDVLNHVLHRTLRNRGEYVRPIELVTQMLASRT
jgi:hypothetical protein